MFLLFLVQTFPRRMSTVYKKLPTDEEDVTETKCWTQSQVWGLASKGSKLKTLVICIELQGRNPKYLCLCWFSLQLLPQLSKPNNLQVRTAEFFSLPYFGFLWRGIGAWCRHLPHDQDCGEPEKPSELKPDWAQCHAIWEVILGMKI